MATLSPPTASNSKVGFNSSHNFLKLFLNTSSSNMSIYSQPSSNFMSSAYFLFFTTLITFTPEYLINLKIILPIAEAAWFEMMAFTFFRFTIFNISIADNGLRIPVAAYMKVVSSERGKTRIASVTAYSAKLPCWDFSTYITTLFPSNLCGNSPSPQPTTTPTPSYPSVTGGILDDS